MNPPLKERLTTAIAQLTSIKNEVCDNDTVDPSVSLAADEARLSLLVCLIAMPESLATWAPQQLNPDAVRNISRLAKPSRNGRRPE